MIVLNIFEKIWSNRTGEHDVSMIANELEISPLIAQILASRGITELGNAKKFLHATIRDLYDPFLLEGMEKSVNRIKRAMEIGEQIVIYGDYDVDGITSISVLLKYFNHVNYPVQFYIPNRLEEGYGVNEDAIMRIAEEGTDLLITVDCGITSVHEANVAKSIGLDMIITDHHECQSELPDCFAIINPKQDTCDYPYDMLAGVGIAFKLVQGLMGDAFFDFESEIIDIAALGTVADVAPISDENRIIAKFGLEKLNETNNHGLKALIDVAGVEGKTLNTGHIGFTLAPRINAAGRIGTPHLGVELLTTEDPQRARALAEELNSLNERRQAIEKEILEEAELYVEREIDLKNELVIVVQGYNWHTGIIGIVASRIAEKYYRPTIILNIEDGVAKGSARSVGRFSIFDAMSSCKDLFTKFGGHAQAAGVSLPEANVSDFRLRVNAFAKEILTERDLIPVLKVDGHIQGRDVSYKLIDELEMLEPFGLSNPKPQFVIEDLQVDKVMMIGKDKNHLKMIVHDQNRVFDSLCFGCEDKYGFVQTRDVVDMVAGLDRNSFRGVETIQLMIKDLRKYNMFTPSYKKLRAEYDLSAARYLEQSAKQGISESINDVDNFECLPESGTTLVVIESSASLYDFIKSFHDKWNYKYLIHFNEVNVCTKFDVVVHPLELSESITGYDHVFYYKATEMLDNMDRIKNEIIPDREALVTLYKSIMKGDTLSEEIDTLSRALGLTPGTIFMSGLILRDLNLIEFNMTSDLLEAKMLPKPKSKIDIFETHLYKSLQSFKNVQFEELLYFKS